VPLAAIREGRAVDSGELKRRVRKARSGGRGRYPAELREAVLAYARHAKRRGTSGAKVASELGLSVQTLQYWRTAMRRRGELLPVAVRAERAPERELVVECGQVRVRGLDLDALAELLKRLT
jgi:transposase-like protein